MVIAIDKAEYLEDNKILFQFTDGSQRVIDFAPFLKNARNPMTRKYLNKDLFRDFKIEYGDITWNDFEMCFPIWDLFEGKI